jgi:hypothetical protein
MVRREDWVAQNHMGSIVLIKPGVLRTVIIRAGHLGLGLLLRVTATDGYLGSMRTVHFAHWAFLNNGSRLLFLSNYDHSWESYLDDFIEKAHTGLTLAWGCGVGFPPTRFLIYDGASHGRRFKNWALASRAVSRFWYSAYPTLTVDQIERNNRIANGLCRKRMSEEEARAIAATYQIEDGPGTGDTRVLVGRTAGGRLIRVIYAPDPVPDSVFVITAYPLGPAALRALRRRLRRRS